MLLQPMQFVLHQTERLLSTFRATGAGACNIVLDVLLSLDKRFNQQANVGLGILYTVERSLHGTGRRSIHRSHISGADGGIRTLDTRSVLPPSRRHVIER